MKAAKKVALSGILAALSVVILLLGSIIETLDMAVAAIASFVIMLACVELRGKYPFFIFAAASVLSMLLLPNKYGVLTYVLFYGYYPPVKLAIERGIRSRAARTVIKGAIFAAAMAAVEAAYFFLFAHGAARESAGVIAATLALAVAAFALFDVALTKLTFIYEKVWRKHIEKYL